MLTLESLTKRFDDGTVAVRDLSLEVGRGEFLTLLGPSGCGKTTTLRMIAGFETPTSGRIRLEDRDVTGLSPQRRGFGMVFQNYALFPHLDVAQNVAFGLKTRGASREELRRRVDESLALVDLAGYGRRRVQELSGGQQQRVALARALAPEPPVLLLDEPLSNLDAALRERTRIELRALLKRVGITAIFVTHDQEEAFALSDRIAVLERGRLQQLGTPEELYDRPANPFVASFLGRANFLDARVVERDGHALVCEVADGVRWRVNRGERGREREGAGGDKAGSPAATLSRVGAGVDAGVGEPDRVRVMVRPEALRLEPVAVPAGVGPAIDHAAAAAPADPAVDPDARGGGGLPDAATRDNLAGTVIERRFAGPVTHYSVRVGSVELAVYGSAGDAEPGDDVVVRLAGAALAFADDAAESPESVAAADSSGTAYATDGS